MIISSLRDKKEIVAFNERVPDYGAKVRFNLQMYLGRIIFSPCSIIFDFCLPECKEMSTYLLHEIMLR